MPCEHLRMYQIYVSVLFLAIVTAMKGVAWSYFLAPSIATLAAKFCRVCAVLIKVSFIAPQFFKQ